MKVKETAQLPDVDAGNYETPCGRKVHAYGEFKILSKSYGFDIDTGEAIKNPDYLVYTGNECESFARLGD